MTWVNSKRVRSTAVSSPSLTLPTRLYTKACAAYSLLQKRPESARKTPRSPLDMPKLMPYRNIIRARVLVQSAEGRTAMNDVARLIVEAWEKLGPRIKADPQQLARRLARRRLASNALSVRSPSAPPIAASPPPTGSSPPSTPWTSTTPRIPTNPSNTR
jgi:hypothetical protein